MIHRFCSPIGCPPLHLQRFRSRRIKRPLRGSKGIVTGTVGGIDRDGVSICERNMHQMRTGGKATIQLETARYPSTEVAQNINLIVAPAKTLNKPLMLEFNLRTHNRDYKSPFPFHAAKMRLHFASASLIASSGVASPVTAFTNITVTTCVKKISLMAALAYPG